LAALWPYFGSDLFFAFRPAHLGAEQAQHEAGEGGDGGEFPDRLFSKSLVTELRDQLDASILKI
jgi:hypothetical protein